jgi:hypothetical protein
MRRLGSLLEDYFVRLIQSLPPMDHNQYWEPTDMKYEEVIEWVLVGTTLENKQILQNFQHRNVFRIGDDIYTKQIRNENNER